MILWQLPEGYLRGLDETWESLRLALNSLERGKCAAAGVVLDDVRGELYEALEKDIPLVELSGEISAETAAAATAEMLDSVSVCRANLSEAIASGTEGRWLGRHGREVLLLLVAVLDDVCACRALSRGA